MNTFDLISDLRTALSEVKLQGNSAIPISGLEAYLAEMEKITVNNQAASNEIVQRDEARRKFEHDFEVWKVQAPLRNAANVEMFKSVLEAGQTALKSATLINGGAAAALLAFIGNLITKDPPPGIVFPIQGLNQAMMVFAAGVGLSGLATGVRYLTQWAYGDNWRKTGQGLNVMAVLLGLASFLAFFIGAVVVYKSII